MVMGRWGIDLTVSPAKLLFKNWREEIHMIIPNLGELKKIIIIKEYIWISSNEMGKTGAHYTEWSKPER